MTRNRPTLIAVLLATLAFASCRDATAPSMGVATYTLTLLPSNTVTEFSDRAYSLVYRAGPGETRYNFLLSFGRRLEFDQCDLPSTGTPPGQFPVNGTGIACGDDTSPSPILLSASTLQIPGTVDQSTSNMTVRAVPPDRTSGRFIINFRSNTGQPIARLEGTFTATPGPCQSMVGSDGLLTGPCTLVP